MPSSPALPHGLVFVDSPSEFRDAAALVVRVPCGIRSKEKLLAVLSGKLRFPGYFGWNWDAFEECLNDLTWLPPGPIILVHEDLPFGVHSPHRATYLDILRGTAAHHVAGGRALTVVLPSELREEISLGASEQR